MKKNRLKLGFGILTVLATPIAVNTVAGTEVHAAQGWVQSGSSWYYYYQGNIVRNVWIGSYWLGSDGKMATNTWVDGERYYVGANGVWDKNVKKQEAPKPVEKKNGWIKEDNIWYYYNQGIMVRNAWQGNYWLGSDGKMAGYKFMGRRRTLLCRC